MASVALNRVTEIIKMKVDEKYHKYINGLTISAVLGLLFSFGFGLDLFAEFGMVSDIPGLGKALTGFLLSGGAAGFDGLLEMFDNIANGVVIKKEEE